MRRPKVKETRGENPSEAVGNQLVSALHPVRLCRRRFKEVMPLSPSGAAPKYLTPKREEHPADDVRQGATLLAEDGSPALNVAFLWLLCLAWLLYIGLRVLAK